jgi:hypothetical protein
MATSFEEHVVRFLEMCVSGFVGAVMATLSLTMKDKSVWDVLLSGIPLSIFAIGFSFLIYVIVVVLIPKIFLKRKK